MKADFRLLILVWLLIAKTQGQYEIISCLNIRHMIFNDDPDHMTGPSANGYDFVYTHRSEQNDINNVGLILQGVHSDEWYTELAYRVSTPVVTSTYVDINVNIVDSSMWQIQMVLLVARNNCFQTVAVFHKDFVPTTLTISNSFENFYLDNPDFTMTAGDSYVSAHLRSFNMDVPWFPVAKSQSIRVYSWRVFNSTTVEVQMHSQSHQANDLRDFSITVLVVKKQLSPTFLYKQTRYQGSFSDSHGDVYFNSTGYEWSVYLCIVSLNWLETDSIYTADWFGLFHQAQKLRLQNLEDYIYDVYCFVQCSDGYAIRQVTQTCINCGTQLRSQFVSSHPQYCFETCSDYLHRCYACNDTSACLECYVGSPVVGGCSDVYGCVQVRQENPQTGNHTSVCIDCSSEFILQDGICVCGPGEWLVNGHCTAVWGCVATTRQAGVTTCIACDVALDLYLSGQNCSCFGGFYWTGLICWEVCADGQLYTLDCDDGNTVDGDGCSADCAVEQYYVCENGTYLTPSECVFAAPVDLSVSWMENTGTANEGVVALGLSIEVPSFSQMNFTELTNFAVDELPVQVKSWQYENQQLKLYFDYNFTLQGGGASLNISIDSSLLRSTKTAFELGFVVDSRSVQMVMQEDLTSESTITVTLFISCLLAWAIVFVSMFFDRLAGLQLMHTLQVVFLLHFQTQQQTNSLNLLQQLTYTTGNFFYRVTQKSDLPLSNRYTSMAYNSTNYHVTLFIFLSALTLPILISLGSYILQRLKSQKTIDLRPAHQLQLEPFRPNPFLAVALRVSTSLALVFFTPIILMVVAFVSSRDPQQTAADSTRLRSLPRVYLLVLVTPLVFRQLLRVPPQSLTTRLAPSQQYAVLYLSFVVLTAFAFAFAGLDSSSLWIRWMIGGGALALLLAMLLAVPVYSHCVHSISAGFNLLVILLFACALEMRDLFPSLQTQASDKKLLFVIVALLSLTTFTHLCRLIHIIVQGLKNRSESSNSPPLSDLRNKFDRQELYESIFDKFEEGGKYSLATQILKDKRKADKPIFIRQSELQILGSSYGYGVDRKTMENNNPLHIKTQELIKTKEESSPKRSISKGLFLKDLGESSSR